MSGKTSPLPCRSLQYSSKFRHENQCYCTDIMTRCAGIMENGHHLTLGRAEGNMGRGTDKVRDESTD